MSNVPTRSTTDMNKLAVEVIDHWEEDELKEYARLQLIKEYKKYPSLFKQDWENMFFLEPSD